MPQRAAIDVRPGHIMDAPVTVSNLAFFRSVQAGYQAYQHELTPFNEHDIYECLVHRLLAYPDSACENTGWVKGLLEAATPQQSSLASPGRRSEVPAPYGDNFLPVIPTDTQRHSVTNPFCFVPSCPCHDDQDNFAEIAQYVNDGLLTPDEATDHVAGKHL